MVQSGSVRCIAGQPSIRLCLHVLGGAIRRTSPPAGTVWVWCWTSLVAGEMARPKPLAPMTSCVSSRRPPCVLPY